MITDRMPYKYAARVEGAKLEDIVPGAPAKNTSRAPKKDLRPIIVLSLALCYSVTIGVTSITVISINGADGASVAKSCIETGGQWVIDDTGQRECVREKPR